MTTTLPRPVAPVWARPSVDVLPDAERDYSLEEEIAPGQMTRVERAERMRDDLLPDVLACRDTLATLTIARTPTGRALLARTDRLVREVSDPAWSPDDLNNAMTELTELLGKLRALLATRTHAVITAVNRRRVLDRALAAARRRGERLAELLARTRQPALVPHMPSGKRLSSSSLSRTDPPALLWGVVRKAARNDAQTVITT